MVDAIMLRMAAMSAFDCHRRAAGRTSRRHGKD
jgi:hypothetical protein